MTKKEKLIEKYGDHFYSQAIDYISALRQGRLQYIVTTVAKSGMSRMIKITSCDKGKGNNYYYRNYNSFLRELGYKPNNCCEIRVSGCGMNMLFATNYNICHDLKKMGFIGAKQCDILAQKIN